MDTISFICSACASPSLAHYLTNTAFALPLTVNVGVGLIKNVTPNALSTPSVYAAETVASMLVDLGRDCFEMLRVYTGSIATQMVELEPHWNWPILSLVCHPMSLPCSTVHPKAGVSLRVYCACPH